MPVLTIITVNLNNASGLRKTIESVICQTFADYEYLIIDGGSTDGSVEVIKEYAERFTYWVSEPDCGIYDAMNKGVKYTHGEWIIFMNSGDVFCQKNVLTDIFSINSYNDTDIIYGNTIVKDINTTIKPSAIINKNFFFFNTICHQSLFLRRNIFDQIGYHSLHYKIISDREFLLRAAIKYVNFKYVDVDICIWESQGFSSKNIHLIKDEESEMRNIHFNVLEIFLLKVMKKISNLKNKFYY